MKHFKTEVIKGGQKWTKVKRQFSGVWGRNIGIFDSVNGIVTFLRGIKWYLKKYAVQWNKENENWYLVGYNYYCIVLLPGGEKG